MRVNDSLNVWYERQLVGQLWQDDIGRIGFRYDNDWLKQGFAISQQLPLDIEEYSAVEAIAHRFFVNLLPEAGARQHLVRDLKISNSDFSLLKAIGGECAGALSVLPENLRPITKTNYKRFNDADLTKLLLRKGNVASFVSEKNRPRLSLAGAQDKCPIFYDDSQYYLPEDAAPSTHIIKFEISGYSHIPAYEYLLTQLARSIELPTVECELKQHQDLYFLLVKRYDRLIQEDEIIKRLHQEDFCQALGIGYEHKYQQEGGPSFYDCYKLIQQVSTRPIVDAENLIKWQIFNWLAGNSDGHAKNLALIYDEHQQLCLAPFYDLVCTRAVARIDSQLALSIGNEFNPDKLEKKHWQVLAEQCNIRQKYLLDLIAEMAEGLLNHLDTNIKQFEALNGRYPALQRVKMVVNKQCKKALKKII